MQAGIAYWDKGFGIGRDAALLDKLLRSSDYTVRHVRVKDRTDRIERGLNFARQLSRFVRRFDIQFHLEQIRYEQFWLSRRNYIIPNPEFTDPQVLKKISGFTAIACKTRSAVEQFEKYDSRVVYLGFTSPDRYMPGSVPDYRKFLHLAGKSDFKGTGRLLSVWKKHPEWPLLTVVRSPTDTFGKLRDVIGDGIPNVRMIHDRLSDEAIREMQNQYGVHLCPSETEGFGHYIMEALSAKGVVLTTDAPPMNELVRPEHGFPIPAQFTRWQMMNPCFSVTAEGLEAVVSEVLSSSDDTLRRMGELGRKFFEKNDRAFRNRALSLIRGEAVS